jgi:uncharacterized membrane protein
MLVVIFGNERAAEAGTHAMKELHAEGGITLYSMGVIAKDANGKVSVKESPVDMPIGAGVGLAVGALIGMLGGPMAMVVGAVAGTVVGAMRDFWVAGVGIDFVEETEKFLTPGKVALIAEVEEEWVIPVDVRMEKAGGVVFRRARADVAEAQYESDIAAFGTEIAELEAEAKHATGAAKTRLLAKIAMLTTTLDGAIKRARQRADALTTEAEGKIASLNAQIAKAEGEAKATLEVRMKQVRTAYDARIAKLKKAWGHTKQWLASEPTVV